MSDYRDYWVHALDEQHVIEFANANVDRMGLQSAWNYVDGSWSGGHEFSWMPVGERVVDGVGPLPGWWGALRVVDWCGDQVEATFAANGDAAGVSLQPMTEPFWA